jgi:hypothetical protein
MRWHRSRRSPTVATPSWVCTALGSPTWCSCRRAGWRSRSCRSAGYFRRHGPLVPGVTDQAGGEHANGPVPTRPPHLHRSGKGREQGLGLAQGRIPQHEEVLADAQEGHRTLSEGQIHAAQVVCVHFKFVSSFLLIGE